MAIRGIAATRVYLDIVVTRVLQEILAEQGHPVTVDTLGQHPLADILVTVAHPATADIQVSVAIPATLASPVTVAIQDRVDIAATLVHQDTAATLANPVTVAIQDRVVTVATLVHQDTAATLANPVTVATPDHQVTVATLDHQEIRGELAHLVTPDILALHRQVGIQVTLEYLATLAIQESVDTQDIPGRGSAVILATQDRAVTAAILD